MEHHFKQGSVMLNSFDCASELEILSHINDKVRMATDIGGRLDQLMDHIEKAVPFHRSVIVYEREGKSPSCAFVYSRASAQRGGNRTPGQLLCGEPVGVGDYVGSFETSGDHDYGFRWRDIERSPKCLGLSGIALATHRHMRGGAGLAALIRSSATDRVTTLLQIECDESGMSSRQMQMINLVALCLHSSFMLRSVNPSLQNRLLAVNLTTKERDVLTWVVEGKTSWEIGQILSTSERTVKFHLKNVYTKLNVSNRAQAVAAINRLGLIS